ncbi:MAG: hypothetical protein U9R72_16755 [Chloroflexota bacterium]|nr:hypothetical protein [Chloroflexota bacterium]
MSEVRPPESAVEGPTFVFGDVRVSMREVEAETLEDARKEDVR